MAVEVEAHQAINSGATHSENEDPGVTVSTWSTPEYAPHSRADEIIRQVEWYFGDENLPQDAHLLGLIKEGNGLVNLNEMYVY